MIRNKLRHTAGRNQNQESLLFRSSLSGVVHSTLHFLFPWLLYSFSLLFFLPLNFLSSDLALPLLGIFSQQNSENEILATSQALIPNENVTSYVHRFFRAALFISTGMLQEFLKHAIPDYLLRGTDHFSLRLSKKK